MNQQTTPNAGAEFALQRIYATISSEVPNVPEVFDVAGSPNLDIKVNVQNRLSTSKMGNHIVELTVVVMAKEADRTLFLVEICQGGIFNIQGFDDTTLAQIINVNCPSLLYPYASALVSDVVLRAGFMPLHLPPVDFHAMHEQKQSESKA